MAPELHLKLMLTALLGVTALFAVIEHLIGPVNRRQLGESLRESSTRQWWRHWPDVFATQFDTVFGRKLFSQRRLGRSCAASLICFAIGVGVFSALDPRGISWSLDTFPALLVLGMINVIPDFLSHAKTRWVMGLIQRRPSPLRVLALLLLDLIVTVAMFITPVALLATLLLALGAAMPPEVRAIPFSELVAMFLQLVSDTFVCVNSFPPQSEMSSGLLWGLPIAYCTTFFASIWLWCFLLSSLLWRIGDRLLAAVGGGLKELNMIEKHPLLLLAVALDLMTALIFALSAPFVVQWG